MHYQWVLKMNKTLEVFIKNIYGNNLIYPNCSVSKMMAKISGNKTLNDFTIKTLKDNGYEFKVVPELNKL
mgnify:CR=1 FL=1